MLDVLLRCYKITNKNSFIM